MTSRAVVLAANGVLEMAKAQGNFAATVEFLQDVVEELEIAIETLQLEADKEEGR